MSDLVFDISGDVIQVGPEQKITDNFSKQEIIVKEKGKEYPGTFTIEFSNKGLEKLQNIRQGDDVTARCALNGRAYDKGGELRTFISLRGLWINMNNVADRGLVQSNSKHDRALDQALDLDADSTDLPF